MPLAGVKLPSGDRCDSISQARNEDHGDHNDGAAGYEPFLSDDVMQ